MSSRNVCKKPDARVEYKVDFKMNPQGVDVGGVHCENSEKPFLWKRHAAEAQAGASPPDTGSPPLQCRWGGDARRVLTPRLPTSGLPLASTSEEVNLKIASFSKC